jgi:plasmid stabilization system protein ParE
MALKIQWSDTAKADLQFIYSYYKNEVSAALAKRLVKVLAEQTKALKKNPLMGQREPIFERHSLEIRYLVKMNYKILYYIEDKSIMIARVFDCRQNPTKMKK